MKFGIFGKEANKNTIQKVSWKYIWIEVNRLEPLKWNFHHYLVLYIIFFISIIQTVVIVVVSPSPNSKSLCCPLAIHFSNINIIIIISHLIITHSMSPSHFLIIIIISVLSPSNSIFFIFLACIFISKEHLKEDHIAIIVVVMNDD